MIADPLSSFPPHAIDRALCYLRGEWTTVERTIPLPLSSMLAEAWKPSRLADCRQKLAEGKQAPPVAVVGLRIGKRTFYSLTDGNHRVVAARAVGKTHIQSNLGGYYVIDPKQFVLDEHNRLWKPGTNGWAEFVAEVPADLVGILETIGVRRTP